MLTDSIAAVATAPGEGSIAIIRVSGNQSISAVERIFSSSTPLSAVSSHTIHYGYIFDPENGAKQDEVLVSVMRTPRSFTKEDVVEINCHGGTVAAQNVLRLLLKQGIRLAEPGEFTKRAFLNGRIDLTQAEAVIDLIRAKSDRAFKIAGNQSRGYLSVWIKDVRQRLITLIAHLEVNIDYPEHDTPELTYQYISDECNQIIQRIHQMIDRSRQGKMIREGIMTTIVGRPNVGKSSLLNALLNENRAIVTDIPGTTRDVIEEYIQLNGVPLKLVDTAGIRETDDLVEQIGVERSKAALEQADLILLVLNYNQPLHEEDISILQTSQTQPLIVLVNKTDLPCELELAIVREKMAEHHRLVLLSVKENIGFSELEQAIAEMFFAGDIESADLTYVSNVRHIHLLEQSVKHLQDALSAIEIELPIDIIQIDIREAWEQLGLIIGDSVAESLLDQIFSQFCLGK